MDELPYTRIDFLNDMQKHVANTAAAILSERTMDWDHAAPFLEAARELCRDDLRLNGTLAIHGMEYRDGELVEAEEAYLALAIRDRTTNLEWLSRTYWLSDLALADQDPDRVRSAIAAIERTLDKVKAWLVEAEAAAEPTPSEAPSPAIDEEPRTGSV